ncbi:MAG: SDR family oxidoreductase [Spirochaetes bacterium]|jgi:NAD(P)-dependent dehydrogenase (short-subunit alcohol dehydrogenase family)|nr:SDR family oxidoreductase [Spirochaetota bacterium]
MDLKGKVVLITGASSGIGRAVALAFAKAGARVAIAARRVENLRETASRMKDALVIKADLSDEKQAAMIVEKTVKHFGRIDVLVNNAAAIIVSRADEVRPDDLVRSFRTNLVAPVVSTREAVRHMRRQGGGHIINVGSPGFMIGIPLYAPYVCSKASLTAWTRTIQAEWYGTGIIVSEYFPGYIKTDSPAESGMGPVPQDIFINPDQNFIARRFTRPRPAKDVADQIVRLVLKPKTLVFSGFLEKIGSWLSNIAFIRLSIARGMAATARKKLGVTVFSDD